MKNNKIFASFVCATLISGCASMFQGANQNLTIATVNDKNTGKTRCNIKNEEGAWNAAPDSAVSIHRDGNIMDIQCENDLQTGISRLDPKFDGGYLALDLLLDACIISCIVDGVSNSFYEYPQSATVSMQEK